MLCPFCHHPESQVIDTRPSLYNQIEGIRRRRQCFHCNKRFSSFEMSIQDLEGVEPATLDGILQQIIKVFKDAPRTNYKALGEVLPGKQAITLNDCSKPTVKPETLQAANGSTIVAPTKKDIQEAMRRARQRIAREVDELDASEFDEEDFD